MASRRPFFTAALFTILLTGILGSAAALAAEVVRIQPLTTPEAAAEARRRGIVPRGAVMTPAEQRAYELRAARQRAFQPMERVLPGRGPRVDRARLRSHAELPPGEPGGAFARQGVSAPPDTIHMALLRVDFLNDRGGSASTGDGRFDLSGPDPNAVPLDRPPHNRTFYQKHAEALQRYYEAMSYGRTVVVTDVYPAEEDSAYHLNDMADLGPWTFGQGIYDAAVHMTRSMFFAADSQSTRRGARIPWDSYEFYTIVHAGGDLQSDIRQDSKEDIPSFTIFLFDTTEIVFPDSTTRPITQVSFIPETINQDGYYGTINGVLAHENGHNLFGFGDIYDVSTGQTTVGYWTLMDSGNLLGTRVLLADSSEIYATGLLPPSTDPFQRQFTTDTLEFRTPQWGASQDLAGNERSPVMYRVPLTDDEYLLMENRFLAPATTVELDQDSVTRVILGPKSPDRFEYDALLPGGGILVWKVDESVIPFNTSLRVNEDFGWNSNPFRHGLDVIEADGLDDLGDGGSPFALGSPLDPFQRRTTAVLSDTTQPNLIPNQGTRPHVRIDFTSDADSVMTFVASRTWDRPGWPVPADYPREGPQLLAVDMTGDGHPEICWAGGGRVSEDSSAVFAVKPDGQPLDPEATSYAFTRLEHRPLAVMAATSTGLVNPRAVFAVVTERHDAADTLGGRVHLVSHAGLPLPGWPVRLPALATTPPVIAGTWPGILVFVGCEDGRVRGLRRDGTVAYTSQPLPGPVAGRLAFWQTGTENGPSTCAGVPTGPDPTPVGWLAAGDTLGNVAVFGSCGDWATGPGGGPAWPQRPAGNGFAPDFLWLAMGGQGANAEPSCSGQPTLVAHHLDWLWAWCPSGDARPGFAHSFGDTLVGGLGAGDPDGDGFPEILVQTQHSRVAFVNSSGYPSPGWPKPRFTEDLPTRTAPLCADLDGDGRGDVLALNASGVVAAYNSSGRTPDGFPLGTGSGARGSMLATDLDGDGRLDLVAPDRLGTLHAWSPPLGATSAASAVWPMLGGDPGRTSALPASRTPVAPAAAAGPLEHASLKAYPNPARNKPVHFAYRLSESAQVEFRILDASGHEVASFTRSGQRSDNLETWDPGALPAGLYVARLRFRGSGGEQVETVPLGLLR